MYEQTGRYYAFFGPHATITPEEEKFLAYWSNGKHCALDFGAGLCGSALLLARFGLEVFAFEPSPLLAALAMDRLNREDDLARSITLLEGPTEVLAESLEADFILMRSVFMLLSNDERETALEAVCRHSAPGARMVIDVRTSALPWAEQGTLDEERHLGRTLYRRHTRYTRQVDGSTRVHWEVEAERHGRAFDIAAEGFTVQADTVNGLKSLLSTKGFEVEQIFGAYDIDRPHAANDAMLVAVAQRTTTEKPR
jgi:SAM-dependent methyltransferase